MGPCLQPLIPWQTERERYSMWQTSWLHKKSLQSRTVSRSELVLVLLIYLPGDCLLTFHDKADLELHDKLLISYYSSEMSMSVQLLAAWCPIMHVHAVIPHTCPGMCPHVIIDENSLQTNLAGLRMPQNQCQNSQMGCAFDCSFEFCAERQNIFVTYSESSFQKLSIDVFRCL